jgi:hypothetical protein
MKVIIIFFQKERQAQEYAEEARFAEMDERERRDYDLARRLAMEIGSEADLPRLQRSRRPATNQKYDLNKHSYAQLRDLINTSCGKKHFLKEKKLQFICRSFRYRVT